MRARELTVRISIPPFSIRGTITLPEQPCGLVVLAQGSAASRPSQPDWFVMNELCEAGIGAARLDLITSDEGEIDEDTHLSWPDIHYLAGRLVIATDWLGQQEDTRALPLGYLGAAAHAAVALAAASARASVVRAVVSRQGRPDLIAPALPSVVTPTLSSRTAMTRAISRSIAARWRCSLRPTSSYRRSGRVAAGTKAAALSKRRPGSRGTGSFVSCCRSMRKRAHRGENARKQPWPLAGSTFFGVARWNES